MKLQRRKLLGLSVVAAFCAISPLSAKPKEDQGTSAEELAKVTLPAPNATKVAILPFNDFEGDVYRQRVASAASFLFFQHHGFMMVPILESFQAMEKDGDLEPGEALRKSDAIRIGKSLGANWVIYGAVNNVRVYRKSSLFKNEKKVEINLKITAADCESGNIVFWQTRTEVMAEPDGLFTKKTTRMTRLAIRVATENTLKILFQALLNHQTTGESPDQEEIQKFIDRNWPEKK